MQHFKKHRLRRRTLCLAIAGTLSAACNTGLTALEQELEQEVCAPELRYFATQIEPLLVQQCISCHTAGGVAQATDFVLSSGDSAANFRAATMVAQKELAGQSVLLLKPSLTHPGGHSGGELVPVNSSEYALLGDFVALAADVACNDPQPPSSQCEQPRPGPRLLRRLSLTEYDATVSDLLGIVATYGDRMVVDTVVEGFDNNADALQVSPLLADQLRLAAEDAANRYDVLAAAGCAAGDTCAHDFIKSFGLRSFRRPLSTGEESRYRQIYASVVATETFETALRWVVTAMLQSPSFLYRSELGTGSGTTYTLDAYEIASALSYNITGTLPDATLLQAAADDALQTPEQIQAQALRLFESPKALTHLHRFVSQWLQIDTLATVPKDTTLFPTFTPEIRGHLRGETEAFVEWVVRQGSGTLEELLSAPYSFMNDALATYHGVALDPAAPQVATFRQISHDPTQQAGLLTQGSFLATHARPNSSSPVHRGVTVRERILCESLPPPPPGLNAEPPALDPNLTDRERYAAHSNNPACATCHRLIDPVGFGFERFDGVGRLRSGTLDDSGSLVGTDTEVPFSGTVGLGRLLATRNDVHDCFAELYTQFTYGVEVDKHMRCTLTDLQHTFRDGGGTLETLVTALVATPHFIQRTGANTGALPPPTDPPPPPPPTPQPPVPNDIDVQEKTSADWGVGYCKDITVTNLGTADLEWSIALSVEGTIYDLWNAVASAPNGTVTFVGESYNRVIAASAASKFGFCATR